MPVTIDQDVIDVLSRSTFDETGLKLPGTPGAPDALPRPLYVKTDKVLQACGMKWNKKEGRHTGDGTELVEQALLTGQYTNLKQEFQAFYTPPALAAMAVARARITYGHTVLEPSAGRGALVDPILDAKPGMLLALEIDQRAWQHLQDQYGNSPTQAFALHDFMEVEADPRFDRVVMNPPFSRGQDAKHVMHALQFLKLGGRLVAIMSPGLTFRRDGAYGQLNDMLSSPRYIWTVEHLPDNSFASSGTNVRTILLTADRVA